MKSSIAFQAAWFACVLGGANDRALVGTLVVGAVIGLHLALAQRPLPEALLIAVAAVIGFVWDSWLVALGLMSYPTGNIAPDSRLTGSLPCGRCSPPRF